MENKVCLSCKLNVSNNEGNVTFKCPQCGGFEIIRCSNCRTNATKYRCPNCSFEGPN